MLTGSAQYDSAFSRTKWTLLPGHTKLHYEAEVVVEEMASPIKKKPVTKFDKLRSHAAVAPVISDREKLIREHTLKVREASWDENVDFVPAPLGKARGEKVKPKFAFVKTGHKKRSQYNFPKGTRVLPLGNYLADDYPVADTIVLDVLAKARSQSPLKNVVRTTYNRMELSFFDSPFSQSIVGGAKKRAILDKKEIDIDITTTKVLLRKL